MPDDMFDASLNTNLDKGSIMLKISFAILLIFYRHQNLWIILNRASESFKTTRSHGQLCGCRVAQIHTVLALRIVFPTKSLAQYDCLQCNFFVIQIYSPPVGVRIRGACITINLAGANFKRFNFQKQSLFI